VSASTAAIDVAFPWTGEVVGSVPLMSDAEVRAALDRGAAAPLGLSRYERSQILFGTADRLAAEADELAREITLESGLALRDTRHEVARAVDVFRFAAMEALRDDGESFAADVSPNGRNRRAHTLRVPVRLCAAITPFNHPLNQVAHKVAPALAVGTPIVVKPSEKAPLAALRLEAILRDAGAPAAAVQVVTGDPAQVAAQMLSHDAVEVLSFTGGVAVGRRLAAQLGLRRAALELGGNDPLIVLPDADLDEAAALAVTGAFANSGQRCTAVKRILAVDAIADELVARIVERTRKLRAGDPLDPDTDVGTVIDVDAAARIVARVDAAVDAGAELLAGGGREGALVPPTVVDRVPRDCELVAEETFGPVAPVIRVRDLDDAIALANATPYALSSAVCTNDWPAISRCIRELRCGTVNVREVPGYRTELTPFGGIGASGTGVKEGVREAMRTMSFTKLYTLPWT
jgi:putative phosphonoacetaldehyde dehydrogenase